MKAGWRRMTLGGMGTAAVCLVSVAPASGQAASEQKPVMAEDVFKNIQVFNGIPVNQFTETMGFFAASLGLNCTYCHVPESLQSWEKFAEDVPLKRTVRRMILMVNAINKDNFGGRHVMTCYSCHRGGQRPKFIPSLAAQYGSPPPEDPHEVEIVAQAPPGPSTDQILDKYVQALGGAERLAGLTSFADKGTYEGFETYHMKVPLEVFAKAPGQRTTPVAPPEPAAR
jgi:photosynthetic reaction center cytochrome c subunit